MLRFARLVVEPFKAAEFLGGSFYDPERRGVRLDWALDLDARACRISISTATTSFKVSGGRAYGASIRTRLVDQENTHEWEHTATRDSWSTPIRSSVPFQRLLTSGRLLSPEAG